MRLTHFISGQQVEPTSGKHLPVVDPATGATYAEVPDGDANDVARAVEAATKAGKA